jgi:hypothetical protein
MKSVFIVLMTSVSMAAAAASLEESYFAALFLSTASRPRSTSVSTSALAQGKPQEDLEALRRIVRPVETGASPDREERTGLW